MSCFIISQDKRISNAVQPIEVWKVIDKEMVDRNKLKNMERAFFQFQIKDRLSNEYIDLVDSPIPLVSDSLKTLLEKYDESVLFIPVMLADIKRQKQELYWMILPDIKDCLSPKSEFNKDGTIKKIVIDEKKAAYYKVFKIKGILENFIIVRLDVAESILRRYFTGISFKKLEVDSESF